MENVDIKDISKIGNFQLSSDIEQNTRMLFEVPGLSQTITLTIGNAFFIPKGEGDEDKPWRKFKVTVDDQDCLFFTTHAEKARSVYPIPAVAFTPVGIKKIFESGLPPKEFDVFLIKYLDEIYGNKIEHKEAKLLDSEQAAETTNYLE